MRFGPLIIAAVLAVVAGFFALNMMGGNDKPEQTVNMVERPEAAPVETVNVYIASRYIPIGTVLSADMFTPQPWPQNLAVESFVTDAEMADKLVGQVARSSFQQGEPISSAKVAAADEGSFMAGGLPKGMRAVTINTDETLGVAGFVFPGDKVDILITHRVPRWDLLTKNASESDLTETLLSNVPVLAVDQIANIKEITANTESGAAGAAESTIHVPRTVSLMVSPEDAQKLRLGEKVGQLSLALRSALDVDSTDMTAMTLHQNITQFPIDSIVNPEAGEKEGGDGVRIVRGIEVTEISPLEQKKPLPDANNPLQVVPSTVNTALQAK